MDEVSKNRTIERIEHILSYLLSRKYDHDIKIYFKKDGVKGDNGNKAGNIREKQVLDR
mgnify:CR=1 FL=1